VLFTPFASLAAPVLAVTVEEPDAVGVPETAHEMLAPAATVTGGVGVHAPTVTPGGKPEIAHVALVALAVAAALLVHFTVPEYGTPTVAVVGKPDRSGVISEPVTASDAVVVLFAALPSLPAPVAPDSADVPSAVGVPETVHVMVAPGASVAAGAVGEHVVVKPAGRPASAQLAFVAAIAGAAAFAHVNVPEYGTPMLAVAGKPARLMLMSEPETATALVAVLLPPADVPPLLSLAAPVVAVTVEEPGPVGVPDTGHEMLAPAAIVAGGVGVQAPTVTPGGKPDTPHVAAAALCVAVALFVHLIVPV
jgi:hypothetical protein